jgi:hypothetical protein
MFKKATRSQSFLRLGLSGPAGSGKTLTSMRIAHGLLQPGQRFAVIDTERGSASKYACLQDEQADGQWTFDFDVVELQSFSPQHYRGAIREAKSAEIPVLVIDSLTHGWAGPGGVLEMVDKAKERGNDFAAWRHASPEHNQLVEAMLQYPGHLIATMRSKMAYVMEEVEKNGRKITVPKKVGLQPVQREGMEYEFDIMLDMSSEHVAVVSKSRCRELADAVYRQPGSEIAELLCVWLGAGKPMESPPSAVSSTPAASATETGPNSPARVEPAPPDTEPETAPATFWMFLDGCKAQKERLGAEDYYRVLNSFGVEKANAIDKNDRTLQQQVLDTLSAEEARNVQTEVPR